MKLEEIGTEALKLDELERAELIDLLKDSLEGADPNDSDEDSLTEAIRRGEDLWSGKVRGLTKEELFAGIRAERQV